MTEKNFETLEVGEKYEDRNGSVYEVLYKQQHNSEFPFIAMCLADDSVDLYKPDGQYQGCLEESDYHLIKHIKPKKKIELWVNVYPDGAGTHWSTREIADERASAHRHRTACLHIVREYEDGEGLDD